MLHRIISGILGTLVGVAGAFFTLAYALPAFDDFHSDTIPFWQAFVGVVVTWVIALGAFYMSFRFLRFAFARPKAN